MLTYPSTPLTTEKSSSSLESTYAYGCINKNPYNATEILFSVLMQLAFHITYDSKAHANSQLASEEKKQNSVFFDTSYSMSSIK